MVSCPGSLYGDDYINTLYVEDFEITLINGKEYSNRVMNSMKSFVAEKYYDKLEA